MSKINTPFPLTGDIVSNYSTVTLTVPVGTKTTYESTEGWSKFTNIVEGNAEGADDEKGDVNEDGSIDEQDRDDMVNYIMGNTPAKFNKKAADFNNDEKVDAADLVLFIKMKKDTE